MSGHLSANMKCNTCGELFDLVSKFYLHRREHRKLACQNCDHIFSSKDNLKKHLKNTKNIPCHHCTGVFCNNEHLQKHLRNIRTEEQALRSKENSLKWIKQLDEPVYPSVYENEKEYQNVVRERINEIKDRVEIKSRYQIHNKEIDSKFTYRNIRDMILEIYSKKRNTFKVNRGHPFRTSGENWNFQTPLPHLSRFNNRIP